LERLGINGGLLLAQIINFLILFVFLTVVAWRPLIRALEQRRERIARGLEDARAAEQARANAERDAQKLIEQRRAEAGKLLDEARTRGEEQAKTIVDEAHRDADAIRSKARSDAEEERNAVLGEVRSQVGQLAIAAAERVIGQSVDQGKAQSIVSDFFARAPEGVKKLGDNVEVVSALPLSDDEKKQIVKQTGAKDIAYRVDPSILGGLILRSGDKVVDASVRSNLQGLAGQMR
jgi:F-type H+-transporting ATPase subunit b